MTIGEISCMKAGVENLVIVLVLFTETIWCWIFGINEKLVLYVRKERKSFQNSQPRKHKISTSFLSSLPPEKEFRDPNQKYYMKCN